MTDFLSQLNPQQREAVKTGDGPLLILAGAGSGKTRVIAHRIAYLIAERGVWPRNILAVTFTNKAAEEMRNRVSKLIESLEIGSAPLISTFHSLCVRILRRDIEALKAGYTRSFTIYDQDDTVRLTRNCIRDLGIDDKQLAPRSVQAAISAAKNRGDDITNILKFEEHFPSAKVIRLEENYRSTQNILDLASGVIKQNVERKEKALWTQNPAGEKIRYYQALDAESEARFVASKIEAHLRTDRDIRAAVLYRTNSQSRVFEEAMRRFGLSYNIVGGFSFYERMEVRDIIAYLKLAMNPHDSIALQRVINTPPRGIGKMTMDVIENRARELGVSYWEAISDLIQDETRLAPRAITALTSFQRIVRGLATKAGSAGVSPATPRRSLEESVETRATESQSLSAHQAAEPHTIESTSLVSDLVKATILDTGYEYALKAESSDEAEARLENLQELVNAAVD